VDVLSCLRLMVFNRLCDPGSKLGVLRWLQTVALLVGDAHALPEFVVQAALLFVAAKLAAAFQWPHQWWPLMHGIW
jgi:hypothetical protein